MRHWVVSNAEAPQTTDKVWTLTNTDIESLPKCKHHYYASDNYMKRADSWHFPEICTSNAIGVLLQLAVQDGATEIYLVGDIEEHAYRVAKRSCPIPIYNATIGGSLEVHKRVDFYEILKKDQSLNSKDFS